MKGMKEAPPPLDVVQRWFQAVVTHPAGVAAGAGSAAAQSLLPLGRLDRGALEQMVRRSSRLTAEQRLAIYANAYYARLIECLRDVFPVLVQVLGVEIFDGFAFDYLQRYPSRSYTLDRLADSFPRFLEETRPDRPPAVEGESPPPAWPDFLIDLATLELTIAKVFDGPGAEGEPLLAPADLLALGNGADLGTGAGFAAARLVPVPCLRLLRFSYPVNAFYTAARARSSLAATGTPDGAAASGTPAAPGTPVAPATSHSWAAPDNPAAVTPATAAPPELPVPEAADEHVALSRSDFVVRRYDLTPFEFGLLSALVSGATAGEAIAGVAAASELPDDELAVRLDDAFRRWMAAGFFRAVSLP
jgi:hypothetical protein